MPKESDSTVMEFNDVDGRNTDHSVWEPNYDWDGYGFDTRQIHAGEFEDKTFGARITPLYLSNGFRFDSFDQAHARFAGAEAGQLYSRHLNPTNAVAEKRIASLEGGTGAVVVGSGQAAISSALLALLESGDRFLSTASTYSGTRILFNRAFKRLGIDVDYVWDYRDESEWEAAIHPDTKAIFTESIPNPKNDVVDVELVARVARRHGIPLIIDNTVATPYLVRPIEQGADIVVHSSTKFLSGHGSVISGTVVDGGTFDWANASRRYPLLTDRQAPAAPSFLERFGNRHAFENYLRLTAVNDFGPALSPFNGFLLQQGLETLSLRMERHVSSAHAIAHWLAEQPQIESVDYAGLKDNPYFDVAQRHYGGRTGSVFAFTVKGGETGARTFIDRLQLFSRMTDRKSVG